MNQNYITCKRVTYYSSFDEEAFFAWIKNISCIKSFEGAGDELYLDLVDRELSCDDIRELTAFLYRYKIKMDQLKSFITENNRSAVEPWKKQIYKASK